MPIIEVNMLEGRSHEAKATLVKAITDAVVTAIAVPPDSVRIIIRDMAFEDYAVAGVLKKMPPQSAS